MKRYIIFLSLGLLIGTIISNIFQLDISPIFRERSSWVDVESAALFSYIWRRRVLEVFILWFFSFTMFSKLAIYLSLMAYGFSVGALISMLTMELGIRSIVFYLGMIFPQCLIYIPVWLIFSFKCQKESQVFRDIQQEHDRGLLLKKIFRWSLFFVLIVLLYSIGVFVESFINPRILSFVWQMR